VVVDVVKLVDSELAVEDATDDVVDTVSAGVVVALVWAEHAPIVNVSRTTIAVLTRLIVASFLSRVPLTDIRDGFGYAVDCRRPE
jgi:hypothetical protein